MCGAFSGTTMWCLLKTSSLWCIALWNLREYYLSFYVKIDLNLIIYSFSTELFSIYCSQGSYLQRLSTQSRNYDVLYRFFKHIWYGRRAKMHVHICHEKTNQIHQRTQGRSDLNRRWIDVLVFHKPPSCFIKIGPQGARGVSFFSLNLLF